MQPRTAPKSPQNRPSPQRGGLRPAPLFVLGALALAIGLYAVAGFYGGPWLVDHWLMQYRAAGAERDASRGTVRFNPFTLRAEITALATRDEAAGAAFAADRIMLDLAARSLIELRPVLRSIAIERPRIVLASVADLAALGRRARGTVLGQARIDRLALTDGRFGAGLGNGPPVELSRFDLSLTAFDGRSDAAGRSGATGPAGAAGRFRLDAGTAAAAAIAIEGTLAAGFERAEGQLRLGAIDLGAVTARLGGALGAAGGPRGRLDLSAGFSATSAPAGPALELTDGSVELSGLRLTPAAGLAVTAERASGTAPRLSLAASADGPVVAGRAELDAPALSVTDERAAPRRSFAFDDATLVWTADAGNEETSLALAGRLRGAADASLTVQAPLSAPTPRRSVMIEATGIPAAMLSPYAADALGRGLSAGTADLGLDYSLNGNRIDGSLHLVAHALELAPRSAGPALAADPDLPADAAPPADPDPPAGAARPAGPAAGGASPSLELAAALLENRDGVIEIDLPFAATTGSVRAAASAALAARLDALTYSPFDALGALIEEAPEPANAVPFPPGDAALGEPALASIEALANALNARPRLGLRVHGGYDATLDRDALAAQQIELHVQLATAGPSLQARPAPVDFDSPRAQDVLDEFAGERLPAASLAELGARFACENAAAPACERAYYEQIFAALVANEQITSTALSRLGRFRAQSVVDAFRQRGIADQRLEIATGGDVVATPFGVGLPIELTPADLRNPE